MKLTKARGQGGFTLVEVLVALLALAILASLSWQGLDGILRAREVTRASLDRSTRLATVVTQWEQDLHALHDTGVVPALAFDGQTLRLTRRVETGVALVAWCNTIPRGRWRWAGPATTRSGELQQGWLSSFQFVGNEPGHLLLAEAAGDWQIYFHRGGAWTNAQSSGDLLQPSQPQAPASGASAPAAEAVAATAPREALPEAVRLVITLDGRTLTRDIALGPTGS